MNASPSAEALALTDANDVTVAVEHDCPAARVVARWHDDVHPGAFATCDLQPCDAVQRVST